MERLNVKNIIKNNSNIDENLYKNGMEKIRKLRELGIAKSYFSLNLPYSQKVKHEDDDNLICKF